MNDYYFTGAGKTLVVSQNSGVLNNDTNVGSTPTVELIEKAKNGTLSSFRTDGSFIYTPSNLLVTQDSFLYRVWDGNLPGNLAKVVINVGSYPSPVFFNDSYVIPSGGTITIPGISSNDLPWSGTALLKTTYLTQLPTFRNGDFIANPDGTFTISVGTETNPKTFKYSISDAADLDNILARRDIKISISNFSGTQQTSLYTYQVPVGEVLHVSSPSTAGNSLNANLVADVTKGVLNLASDGAFTYDPNPGTGGESDTFTYLPTQGMGLTTVTISIISGNEAPVVTNSTWSVTENSSLNIVQNEGLLTNSYATDPNSDPMHVTRVRDVNFGTLTLGNDGAFTYTPETNFSGQDSFDYIVVDSLGAFSQITRANINVTLDSTNLPPQALADTATTLEDTMVSIPVLANDADPHSDILSVTSFDAISANGGSITQNGGNLEYTPALNFNGADTFTYTITDGALTDTATVTITVISVNDAPVAGADRAGVVENESVAIPVLSNDTDVENNTLEVFALGPKPDHGTAMIGNGGLIIYTPDSNYVGLDSFTYRISDGFGGTCYRGSGYYSPSD